MIEVHELTKVYDSAGLARPLVAVRGVSFTCPTGEVFGLLGSNGAGKTTTLRILSTVLSPTSGTASVAGHDVCREPEAVRRAIGFVSGTTGTYARLTPREMLRFFGRLHGLSEEALAERTEELFERLDLRAAADRPCGTLSTGQRQKASLARALVHDPPVLILDEPTTGLDVLVARAVVDLIRSLRGPARTILISTHILSVAERLCDRLAIVHGGRVLASGRVGELEEEHGAKSIESLFFSLVGAESR